MRDVHDLGGGRPAREPALNLPWPVAGLIGALVLAHAGRLALGVDGDRFAFTSADLPQGRLEALLTYQFVHGSWTHLVMNSAAILAFGAPVARYLGRGARGGLMFLAFFLSSGAVAAIAYAAMAEILGVDVPAGQAWALVGASGSASGLMGAAARLIEGRGRLGPLSGRTVWGMTVGWTAVNVVLGASGLTPGAAGVPVAWQAHIFGFLAGLLLIWPIGWAAGAGSDHENAL